MALFGVRLWKWGSMADGSAASPIFKSCASAGGPTATTAAVNGDPIPLQVLGAGYSRPDPDVCRGLFSHASTIEKHRQMLDPRKALARRPRASKDLTML